LIQINTSARADLTLSLMKRIDWVQVIGIATVVVAVGVVFAVLTL
jgi:hypothetical protein